MPNEIQPLDTALKVIAIQEKQIANLEQEVALLKAFIQTQSDVLSQAVKLIRQTSVIPDSEGGGAP